MLVLALVVQEALVAVALKQLPIRQTLLVEAAEAVAEAAVTVEAAEAEAAPAARQQ
jgi:hypothetical protein